MTTPFVTSLDSTVRPVRITSLASLKRAIATYGIRIVVLAHWQPQLVNTRRSPDKVQTNGYWFYGPNHEGVVKHMWADTPKASQLLFNEDGTVTYYPGTLRSWTLRFELSHGSGNCKCDLDDIVCRSAQGL